MKIWILFIFLFLRLQVVLSQEIKKDDLSGSYRILLNSCRELKTKDAFHLYLNNYKYELDVTPNDNKNERGYDSFTVRNADYAGKYTISGDSLILWKEDSIMIGLMQIEDSLNLSIRFIDSKILTGSCYFNRCEKFFPGEQTLGNCEWIIIPNEGGPGLIELLRNVQSGKDIHYDYDERKFLPFSIYKN